MSLIMEFDSLTPGIQGLPSFVDKAVATTMRYHEPNVENYAKQNAPWTDRTTNARNGLSARSGKNGRSTHYIVLAHQVPYGIWLEVRWSGKYAIIMPTIEVYGPKVMETLEKILDRYGLSR
jgi:hypothetical protein